MINKLEEEKREKQTAEMGKNILLAAIPRFKLAHELCQIISIFCCVMLFIVYIQKFFNMTYSNSQCEKTKCMPHLFMHVISILCKINMYHFTKVTY